MNNRNPRLNFVPWYTDYYQSSDFARLMQHGTDAVVLYHMIVCDIYDVNYKITLDTGYLLDLSERLVYLTPDEVRQYIGLLVKMGLFDPYLFKKYSILTSELIQETYVHSCIKLNRTAISIPLDMILICTSKRDTYRLALEDIEGHIVKYCTVDTYKKQCTLCGGKAAMQAAIDYTGKALVARSTRLEARATKHAQRRQAQRQKLLATSPSASPHESLAESTPEKASDSLEKGTDMAQ